MSAQLINQFLAQGTQAERLAYTPDVPPVFFGPDYNFTWQETDGTKDQYYWDLGTSAWILSVPGTIGTVTSVGLAMPGIFNVSGSPVTGAGTLTAALANQNANLIFAGPSTGAAAAPTFRSLVAADVPTLNQNTTGSAATLTTPRNINGVAFNGSADITVTAAAGTLTGTTLAATVVTSSLTAVGTIATGAWQGTAVGAIYGGTGITSYTTGDLLYASATNVLSKLAATTNGFVLTLAAGIPSWAAASSGGTPGGSTTQLQYNNAGAFGGISGATTNGTATTYTASNLIATSPKFITDISDTNGNEIFKITATASAVNEFTVVNAATGTGPSLLATGGDTNIPITISPKGTGQITFLAADASSPIQFNLDSLSNTLNTILALKTNGTTRGFLITNATAGGGVSGSGAGDFVIRSQGTNIDFTTDSGVSICGQFVLSTGQLLLPKTITSTTAGSGALVVYSIGVTQNVNIGGTLAATSPRFATDISDSSGNELFKLTATGSAVNEFTVANAATGASPTLSASGGDTNVGLIFKTKGSGQFTLIASDASNACQLNLDSLSTSLNTILALKTNGTNRGFLITNATAGGGVTGAGAGDLVIRSQSTNIDFTTDGGTSICLQLVATTGVAEFASTIKTAAPAGASAHPWLLGSFVAGAVTLDATNSVFVTINGTLRKLLVAA